MLSASFILEPFTSLRTSDLYDEARDFCVLIHVFTFFADNGLFKDNAQIILTLFLGVKRITKVSKAILQIS